MAKTRKKPADNSVDKASKSPESADKKRVRSKSSSLRERNKKAAEAKGKPKRTRKAATVAKKPVDKTVLLLTAEHHVFPNGGKEKGFFTKSRSIAPTYVKNSLLELRNVTWPGRKETWRLVFAVFVFALSMGGFIAILDYGLEKVMREVIL